MEDDQQIMEENVTQDIKLEEVFNLKSNASGDFDTYIEPKDKLFTIKQKYTCVECGKLFSRGNKLNGHIKLVHTSEPCICPFCGNKTLKNKSCLALHIKKAHKDFQLPKEETFTTAEEGEINEDFMNKSYINFFETMQNTKIDAEREAFDTEIQKPLIETQSIGQESTQIKCSECGKSFSRVKNLNDHMEVEHIFEPCSCHFCEGTILKNETFLIKHLKQFHEGDKLPTDNEGEIKTKEVPLDGFFKTLKKEWNESIDAQNNSEGIPDLKLEASNELKTWKNDIFEVKIELDQGLKKPANQETVPENIKVLNKKINKKIARKEATDGDINNSQYKLEKSFICDFCGKAFEKAFMLRKHKWVHSYVKPFCCRDCPKTFTTKWIFEQHKLIHTGIKPFQCDDCEKSFRLKDFMKIHKKKFHTNENEKPFVCDLCPQALATKTKFEQHKLIHTGEKPFSCDECGRSFRLKFVMKKHKKVVHSTDNKPLICNTCLKTFKYRGMLEIHEKVHADTPSTCDLCNETFPNFSKMKVHKRTHSEESLCPQCGKSFKSKMALGGHMATGHPSEDQCRICSLCDKEFKTTSSLIQHHRKHTEQSSNPIYCVCPECGKTCKSKRALLDHKRATHPGEGQSRICSLCGQNFKNSANLRQHQRKALRCSKIDTTSCA